MKYMGCLWNEKNCLATHMKRDALDQSTSDMKLEESSVKARLKNGEQYKFLGVQENLKQEDNLVLKCAAEVYLQRISVTGQVPCQTITASQPQTSLRCRCWLI